jgi:hypothetical protein
MDDAGSFRGCVPGGYKSIGPKYGKHLVPDSQREAGIRQAFEDATTGTGTTALGTQLGMSADAVCKLLKNPIYSTGRYQIIRGDGVIVTVRTEPLVKPSVQASAIAALESRRTGDNVTSRAIRKDDFSGALYCPCGAAGRMHRYFGGGKPRKDGSPSPRVRRYRCEDCGKSVRADDADQAVRDLMSSLRGPWMDRWLISGDDHTAELDRARLELDELPKRHLPRAETMAEMTRLYDEIERLEALPSVPARTVTGFKRDEAGNVLTEADRWQSLDNAERRVWLTRGEFRVTVKPEAGRTGRVHAELIPCDDGDIVIVPADENFNPVI